MRFALISDIHGDDAALRAVLDDLARTGVADGIVLGDVAQGGDEPAAVLDRLAELGWPVILGNADWFLLDAGAEVDVDDAALARRAWTLSQLDDRRLEQIRGFHPTYERDGLLAFHGSPRSFDDVLLPETEDVEPWRVAGYRLLAGGHTHTQWVRPIGDALYVNPGSVSIPYERMLPPPAPKPFCTYAVVDDGSIEFRQCAR